NTVSRSSRASTPHPNPPPQGGRESEITASQGITARSTILGLTMGHDPVQTRLRLRFLAALLVFAAWVACLGVLAVRSVRRSGASEIRHVRLTTPRGRVLDVAIDGPDRLPGIGLSRSVLDHLLVQQARAAGVAVLEEARVGHPLVEAGRVLGVAARRPEG